MRFALTVPALALLLAACASVPEAERAAACATTDWAEYGRGDGRLGVPEADRADKFEDCAELGKGADLDAYRAGRAEGLREFCTLDRGYEVGRDGRRNPQVCPPDLALAFDQGWERGRKDRPRVSYGPSVGFGLGFGSRRGLFGYGSYPIYSW